MLIEADLSGSAWASYQKTGTVNGIPLPAGLKESQKFDQPMWTPRYGEPMLRGPYITISSTKAPPGGQDENISPEKGFLSPASSCRRHPC